jgi:hypothetical protein
MNVYMQSLTNVAVSMQEDANYMSQLLWKVRYITDNWHNFVCEGAMGKQVQYLTNR